MAIKVPRIIPRPRVPDGGHRDPSARARTEAARKTLAASLALLPEKDQDFARSLLAARSPTTRQVAFMEALIARSQSDDV